MEIEVRYCTLKFVILFSAFRQVLSFIISYTVIMYYLIYLVQSLLNSISVDAIKAQKLTNQTVLESVKPLFNTRMRLGEFDPPEMNPYSYQ
jgi:hypothetical protein